MEEKKEKAKPANILTEFLIYVPGTLHISFSEIHKGPCEEGDTQFANTAGSICIYKNAQEAEDVA